MEITKRQLQENYNPSDIDFVFNTNPELSEIGTKQEYSQYLSTIFPTSKVKDIVYHGTSKQNYKNILKNGFNPSLRKYFLTPSNHNISNDYSKYSTADYADYGGRNGAIISALINVNKYETHRPSDWNGPESENPSYAGKRNDTSNDTMIIRRGTSILFDKNRKDYDEKFAKQIDIVGFYVVFSPNQIHVLGGEQDIEGFRNFVNRNKQTQFEGMEITKRQLQDEEVTAYHGSPHSFDKFSTQYVDDKGFQTYGWGLYFNDLKSIAKDMIYAKAGEKGGYVYKVTLHKGKTPEQYNWLEWLKPLTDNQRKLIIDQSRKENLKPIKKISFGDEYTKITPESVITSSSPKTLGLSIYRSISEYFDDNKKGASLFLLRAGIDGIKYPKTSDNAKSFGYVVFDENVVNIEKQTKLGGMEVSKKDLIQNWLNNPKMLKEDAEDANFMLEITKGELEEAKKKKADRCTRIAKRKYDVWPSAYSSAAVVRCRQGKIWKGLKEEDENFGSDEINLSDYNGITVELGRSKVVERGTIQNIIVKYNGTPITGENKEPGLGEMNVMIQSKDAFVGMIRIPTELQRKGLSKYIYQATANLIGVPIINSKKRGESQTESGGYVWKNRTSFQPKTNKLDEKTDFSKEKEQGLHGWFARQGGKGKSKGWVDCNTCRDGKCKSCGRKEGEKRSKYPACRPTPSACKSKGKGKSWGKKSKLNEDNQYLLPEEINEVLKGYIETALWTEEERLNDEYGSEHNKVFKDYDDYEDKEDTELDKLIKLSANINNKGIEKFSKEDIESDSLIKAYSDIKKFIQLAGDSVYEAIYENGLERLGTDIWFTRNGHGSGFFDHSYDDDDEKKLIQAGKSLGSVDLYINDNLKLSFSNQHLYEQSKQDIERELKLNENEEFPIQSLYREKENMEIKKKDIFDEDLVLKRDQSKKAIYVQSDLDSDKARSQETFKNKEALKSAGFKWDGDIKSWKTDDVNFMLAKKTIETINKKEFLIDTLEQLEEIIASSENTPEKEGLMGKIDMYINDLSNATDEAAMSSEIRRYLTFFSKFRGHSLFNTWLIYIQSGGKATKVAGFRQWEAKFYRRVKKGAKGLQIFVPIFTKSTSKDDETGEEITKENAVRFKPGYVFDISDTEPIDERGEVPEEPNWFADLEPTERSIELYKYFIELCEDMGIQISKSGSERGEKGYSAGNKINISSAREGAGEVSTLVHEIAHELMHWKKSSIYFQDKTDAKLRELQAESVSYVVLKHYELPTEHHPTYLALWKANKEKIKENVKVITDVAKFIISEIDKIEKRNQKNEVINEQVFKDVKNIFKRFMK